MSAVLAGPPHIIFLHIYKTGGSTFRYILTPHYRKHEQFHLRSHMSAEPFTTLAQEKRNQIKLLHGHMEFGLHRFFDEPARYVTVLRNPVERILSEFAYNMNNPGFGLREKLIKLGIKTPLEMVESGKFKMTNNGQVRLISGCVEKPFGEVDERDYQKAVDNLEKYFDFFTTLKYFDEMVLLMAEKYGWEKPYYLRVNITKGKKQFTDDESKQKISAYNLWDQKLCAYADERMQKIIAGRGMNFEESVERFKNENEKMWLRLKTHSIMQRLLLQR